MSVMRNGTTRPATPQNPARRDFTCSKAPGTAAKIVRTGDAPSGRTCSGGRRTAAFSLAAATSCWSIAQRLCERQRARSCRLQLSFAVPVRLVHRQRRARLHRCSRLKSAMIRVAQLLKRHAAQAAQARSDRSQACIAMDLGVLESHNFLGPPAQPSPSASSISSNGRVGTHASSTPSPCNRNAPSFLAKRPSLPRRRRCAHLLRRKLSGALPRLLTLNFVPASTIHD